MIAEYGGRMAADVSTRSSPAMRVEMTDSARRQFEHAVFGAIIGRDPVYEPPAPRRSWPTRLTGGAVRCRAMLSARWPRLVAQVRHRIDDAKKRLCTTRTMR